jgi:hypothetical protein
LTINYDNKISNFYKGNEKIIIMTARCLIKCFIKEYKGSSGSLGVKKESTVG